MTITKRDHALFLTAVFCFWFATYVYVPVFSLYLENSSFTYTAIGVILGAYGATQVLLRYPLGILSDALKGLLKKLLIVGFVSGFISGVLLVLSDSFAAVFTARLLAGVTASMWVMATIMYSRYFSADQSSRAMGILQLLTVFTQFISMMFSGYLADLFGFTALFWIAAAFSLIGIGFTLFTKEIPVQTRTEPLKIRSLISRTLRLHDLRWLTCASFIGHSIIFMTIFGFTPLYASSIGATERTLVVIFIAFFIPHLLASLFLSFYAVPLRLHKPLLYGSFLTGAAALAWMPLTASLWELSLNQALLGLALGIVLPLLLGMVVQVSPGPLKASAMGFYQSFYAAGILLGPVVAGTVAEQLSLSSVFYFGALLALAGLLITWLIRFQVQTAGENSPE
ncbi:MFS transporter [uncultured Marinococcus sp.]|uniref:MFS transporter n=1 Tax=uncultured Marinococcus sp. TaxID=487012 RepID=UPI002619DD39|nr:MFS transporter [uncultured Marinococcus sp.]